MLKTGTENEGKTRTAFPSSIQEKESHSAFEYSSNFRQKSHWERTAGWFNSCLDFSHSGRLSATVDYLSGRKERKSNQCRITASVSQDRQRECKIKFLMWKGWDNEPLSPRYLQRGFHFSAFFLAFLHYFSLMRPKESLKAFYYFLFSFSF